MEFRSESMWCPHSWIEKKCKQLDFYPFNSKEVKIVTESIKNLPGIVTEESIVHFKSLLAAFQNDKNNSFILHCGDCAESYAHTSFNSVERQVQLIQAACDKINSILNKSIIKIARTAGQFGKPRTTKYESNFDNSVLNYHGDIINEHAKSESGRKTNPYNMLLAYGNSQKIYNYIRAIEENKTNYAANPIINTSHEAFLLPYEEALTRKSSRPDSQHWYNLSAHMLWLGYRSIYEESPHIEFLRGIMNPIGIKVGPNIKPIDLIKLLNTLNPNNEPGKIIIIYRLGSKNIRKLLPLYLQIIQKENFNVLWLCDPMHGNTEIVHGIKFRSMENIISELRNAIEIHRNINVQFSGIHLEVSGDDIVECGFSIDRINHSAKKYQSLMDPRLNKAQMSILIDEFLTSSLTKNHPYFQKSC